MGMPLSQILPRFDELCKNIFSKHITLNDAYFFLLFHQTSKTLMICLFINILLLARRKSSKLFKTVARKKV